MELDNNQSLDSLVNDSPAVGSTGPAPGPNMSGTGAPSPDEPPTFAPNPVNTPMPSDGGISIEDKPSKMGNKAIIIAMIFAVLVALGGIGFGIFQIDRKAHV